MMAQISPEIKQLYYFNGRWMNPDTGRFITEDPMRDGLLWAAFVNNNPMGFVDPTGLSREDRQQRRIERKLNRANRALERGNIDRASNLYEKAVSDANDHSYNNPSFYEKNDSTDSPGLENRSWMNKPSYLKNIEIYESLIEGHNELVEEYSELELNGLTIYQIEHLISTGELKDWHDRSLNVIYTAASTLGWFKSGVSLDQQLLDPNVTTAENIAIVAYDLIALNVEQTFHGNNEASFLFESTMSGIKENLENYQNQISHQKKILDSHFYYDDQKNYTEAFYETQYLRY